jgi:hypothetical protein
LQEVVMKSLFAGTSLTFCQCCGLDSSSFGCFCPSSWQICPGSLLDRHWDTFTQQAKNVFLMVSAE